MNKIQTILVALSASLFATGAAVASPLFIDVAHDMDLGATHVSNPYSAIAGADMTRLIPALASSPDIQASFLAASYDALNQALSVSGFALSYNDGTSSNAIFENFTLNADIDNAGSLFGGTFSIGGLLTGSLIDLAFSTANNGQLDFLFSVTGGSLAAAYGGIGAMGGMIMTQIDFLGDWTNDWLGENGIVDVAALAVSEPGILFLGGLGLTLLVVARRRKI